MYIKTLLKFYLLFIFDVIKSNPVKIVFLVICLLSFRSAGTFPDNKVYNNIVDSLSVKEHTGISYLYISSFVSKSAIKYELITSSTPIKVINGRYEHMEYADSNIVLWLVFYMSLIVLIIAFFLGLEDDDISWDISGSWEDSFSSMIVCEEENGKFYYICLGRLLSSRDTLIDASYRRMYQNFSISGFRDLNLYPKFETKKSKRQSKLDKLGI